jgi:hypothetical protein
MKRIIRSLRPHLSIGGSGVLMALAFLFSLIALWPRWRSEVRYRDVAIIADYVDIAGLSSMSGISKGDVLDLLLKNGVSGLMVSEKTGQELSGGAMPVVFAPSFALPPDIRKPLKPASAPRAENGPAVFVDRKKSYASRAMAFLSTRFHGTLVSELAGGMIGMLPRSWDQLLMSGVLPDFEGLEFASERNVPVLYRICPAPPSDAAGVVESLSGVLRDYPVIRCVSPTGEIAVGYPDFKSLGELIAKTKRTLAVVEFSRQVGAPQLSWQAYPNLLPLHSVTNEEILSRNIGRRVLEERMVRAVKERSVRLLVVRPSAMNYSSSVLETFAREVKSLSDSLSDRSVRVLGRNGWPEPIRPWRNGIVASLACSFAFAAVSVRLLTRWKGNPVAPGSLVSRTVSVIAGGLAVVIALLSWKIAIVARLLGALTAGLVATEASLVALDGWERPVAGSFRGFLFAIVGGLAIAALFSEPTYMLRLRSFSGVKLTLMLPLLVVILHDFRNRIHPESLGTLIGRPPVWGELMLLGVLLLGAALMLFRSDNVQFVPDFEVRVRDMLERFLVARPRNKELFVGYPALFLLSLCMKERLWQRYREILRLAVTLAFSSVVNSFCHFHTPLAFILFREFNGWWSGVLAGTALLFLFRLVIIPLWGRVRGAIVG